MKKIQQKTIVKILFGSHLYGTNTATSDHDYKGVFQASYEDIILKRDKHSLVYQTKVNKAQGEKNGKDDVDTEYKELRRFLKDALDGQTYALDMLFAPEENILESSPEWEFIIKNREKIISKQVEPYIGYIRRQVGKYGLKGSRLGELEKVIERLQKYPPKTAIAVAMKGYEWSEHICVETTTTPKGSLDLFVSILGKKFPFSLYTKQVLDSLVKLYNKYGDRAKQAKNNEGIDWKAVSHAFRCSYQLEELANTGYIIFPLKEREKLKKLKQGGHEYSEVQEELTELMERVIETIKTSDLPEKPDESFWENFILNTYKNVS